MENKDTLPANITEYRVPGTKGIILVETEENTSHSQLLQGHSLCLWQYNEAGKLIPIIAFNRESYYVYARHAPYVYELFICGQLAQDFETHWQNVNSLTKYRMENASLRAALTGNQYSSFPPTTLQSDEGGYTDNHD